MASSPSPLSLSLFLSYAQIGQTENFITTRLAYSATYIRNLYIAREWKLHRGRDVQLLGYLSRPSYSYFSLGLPLVTHLAFYFSASLCSILWTFGRGLYEFGRVPAGTALTARLHWLSQWLIKHSDVQRSNNALLAARVPLDVGVAVVRLTRD